METDHNVEVIQLQEEHGKALKEIEAQYKKESAKLSTTGAELQAELESLRGELKGEFCLLKGMDLYKSNIGMLISFTPFLLIFLSICHY